MQMSRKTHHSLCHLLWPSFTLSQQDHRAWSQHTVPWTPRNIFYFCVFVNSITEWFSSAATSTDTGNLLHHMLSLSVIQYISLAETHLPDDVIIMIIIIIISTAETKEISQIWETKSVFCLNMFTYCKIRPLLLTINPPDLYLLSTQWRDSVYSA